MSVKDRVISLELRMEHIDARMHHYEEGMRVQSNNEKTHLQMKVGLIVGEIKRRTSEDIERLEERIGCVAKDLAVDFEDLKENFETHRTFAHNELDFIKERLNKLEALEARVEELENAEADTRRNAPAATKPEKFIKVVDDKSERHLLRFNNIDSIKSYWEDKVVNGNITFIVGNLWVIKLYIDKEKWQHDLNKIEWFVYDDALLLDLTGVDLSDTGAPYWPKWKSCKGLPGFCPYCGSELLCYAKTGGYLGEAARMCTKCNYKES